MKKFSKTGFIFLCSLFLMAYTFSVSANNEITVKVLDEKLTVQHFPASGQQLVLYIASGYGFSDRSTSTAKTLSGLGVEVWMVDLADNFFLPKGNRSIRTFDGRYVAGLIEQAHKRSTKNVTLLTSSFGAIPVLRGARRWQINNHRLKKSYLNGAILFSPELYQAIPALGVDPLFEPIISATNIPLMIYQSELRNNRWQLDNVVQRLKKGKAVVYQKIIPNITSFFYVTDSLPPTQKALKEIPLEFPNIIKLLQHTPTPLLATKLVETAKIKHADIDIELRRYKGNRLPLPLDLININGKRVVRKSYKNKVTVVNFWATWCSPCVQEIPSLNRLSEKMNGHKFELISINFGEEKSKIDEFLTRVKVKFPVLLDEKGRVAGKWNTIALPSTFVIGPDGKFAYAVNAAIEWDAPKVVDAMKKLANQ